MTKFSNVCIVGGGAAGWLTALYVNKISPKTKITLIESETIGILGAGEGSVPTLTEFLRFLDINESEFILETNATHKLGILFDNWNGDGKDYFHSFGVLHQKLNYSYDDDGELINEFVGLLYQTDSTFLMGEISEQLARKNKSPLIDGDVDGSSQIANYSYHFDAHLVSKFLRKKAEERGIIRVEGIVKNFIQDSDSNIRVIELNDKKIECDFVFDCSGFKRLIIGNLFKSPWKSYTNQLKVNTAIAFQLPQFDEKIEPYTKAVCMKNGWMWQIPLQNRIGCGYIFDKNYISENEAKLEVEELLGHPIQVVNTIKFDAGAYRKVWIKNCLAIGLSSAFTEPIEATSIFNAITQLWVLNHDLMNRDDSEFWKQYLKTTQVPESLQKLLDSWDKKPINISHFSKDPFTLPSWLQVGFGLDLFKKNVFIDELKKINVIRMYKHIDYLKKWGDTIMKHSIDEKKWLTIKDTY